MCGFLLLLLLLLFFGLDYLDNSNKSPKFDASSPPSLSLFHFHHLECPSPPLCAEKFYITVKVLFKCYLSVVLFQNILIRNDHLFLPWNTERPWLLALRSHQRVWGSYCFNPCVALVQTSPLPLSSSKLLHAHLKPDSHILLLDHLVLLITLSCKFCCFQFVSDQSGTQKPK